MSGPNEYAPKPVPHILIAAARKSSGKTSVSLGLARALTQRGLRVQTFKKGPDFIDPLWLEKATGRSCYNLDFNTQNIDEIKALFADKITDADIAIIETNKGLFDGIDVAGADSNAQLAKLLASPVILVIDTVGMTRGIAPLLHGYQTFDEDIDIAGVILNKTGGPRHEGKLRRAIERYNKLPVLGAVGRNDALSVDERHLGLTTPGDVSGATKIIDTLAAAVCNCVDLDAVLDIARKGATRPRPAVPGRIRPDVKIGIARDAAFGFYYPDDLAAMEATGAELVYFDALKDPRLPDIDGLFIGGGFPETNMEDLSQNKSLREDIKKKIQAGLPAYAECGGLMYLCQRIIWNEAHADMVGIIPGDAVMNEKPQGRGIAHLSATAHAPWQTGKIKAHEFHHASLANLPDNLTYAYEVTRGHGIDGQHDGIVIKNMLANFCHLRHTGANRWADRFVDFVRRNKFA